MVVLSAARRVRRLGVGKPPGRDVVSAIARTQIPSHSGDRGDADTRQLVDFPIGQVSFEEFHHSPSIGHRLQLGRGAQIPEKSAALLDGPKSQDGLIQISLSLGFLPGRLPSMGFHVGHQREVQRTNILVR